MRLSRLAVGLVPIAAAIAIAASPGVRKDPYGVYGMIDSVVFEPASGTPDRVQLWGAFALANVVGVKNGQIDYIQIGFFHQPQRGYMYYTVNRRDEAATRADWAALQSVAGTGKLVAWGAHVPPPGSGAPTPAQPARAPDSVDGSGVRSVRARDGQPALDTAYARVVNTYNGRIRPVGEPIAAPDTFPQRLPSTSATPRRVMLKSAAELGFVRPDTTR